MTKHLFSLIAVSVVAASSAVTPCSAGIGEWKNYTDMKNVVSLVSTRDAVWAGTSGGVLCFRTADSSFRKITNSEGLTGNDVSAIGLDARGSIWVGEKSGAVDIYSPATNSWQYLQDIRLSTKPQKSVNAFYAHGDSMYIATGFGVSLFSLSRFEFRDTYSNFGTFVHPNATGILETGGRFYVATSSGVAISKTNAPNLAAPEGWDSFTYPLSANDIAEFRGSVYAASDSGLFVFANGAWSIAFGIRQAVRSLVKTDSLLYIMGTNAALTLSSSNVVSQFGAPAPASIACATFDSARTLVIGLQSAGIALMQSGNSQWRQFTPNGPASNSFFAVAIDNNGVVWAASARSGGSGFYAFDGSTWRNYNTANTPVMTSNDCFNVAIGPGNSKWIGTWGGGLVLLNSAGNVVRVLDDHYPGFVTAVTNNPRYFVIGKSAADRFGNMWVPNFGALNGNVLWRMKPDSTWDVVKASSSDLYNLFLGILIDRNDTKWFSNYLSGFPPSNPKFKYYNQTNPIAGLGNDYWGDLTVSDGMTNSGITSLAEDKDGTLWVGTDLGITIIDNTASPASQISKVFLGAVRDQFINTIVVDPLNNKWVATRQGVDVLSPDGTSLLAQYNVTNTNGKLVNNNVLSIAFDDKRGIAYFGTESGLSSVEVPAIATVEKLSSLEVGPNPFIMPDNASVTIKGLVDNTAIKILSVTGSLVKEFAAQGGGRAFWDGTDANGKAVGSGVYFVVAFAENGAQVATGKVALVRR